MIKFISTFIIATFTAVCSFGVAAGSDISDKDKETMRKEALSNPSDPQNMSKKEGEKYGGKSGPVSEKDRETMRKETMGKPGGDKSMSQQKSK